VSWTNKTGRPTLETECRNCGKHTTCYGAYNRWFCIDCLKAVDKRNAVNSEARRKQVEDALPVIPDRMSKNTNVRPGESK
jgi:phosphoribosyl 1,2-cyclic phosphodiesterase